MALFTDGTIGAPIELKRYESAIQDVAQTENVDLDVKLAVAQDEIGIELEAFLRAEGVSSGADRGLRKVVVTEPLRHWHLLHTLALIYRDVYGVQFNDRYKEKRDEYQRLTEWASSALFRVGVGLVWTPIERPAAPVVSAIPGDGPSALYYIQTSWTNGTGAEGAPSEIASVMTTAGFVPVVSVAEPPVTAGFWNVYAGLASTTLALQNDTPLAAGAAWSLTPGGLVEGRAVGNGQAPDYFLRPAQRLLRG